jgi:Fur family peroxide stress response transcriptional regulator
VAIIKALLAADHPTIEELYRAVKRDFPMTSLVTVYRTMSTLREAGEVLEVDAGDLVAHYDGQRPTQHPHLVCTVCGRVADSPALDMQALTTDLGQRAGEWALSEEVHIYGLCPDCQAKRPPEGTKGGE